MFREQHRVLIRQGKLPEKPSEEGIDPTAPENAGREIDDARLAVLLEHDVSAAPQVAVRDTARMDLIHHRPQLDVEVVIQPLSDNVFEAGAGYVFHHQSAAVQPAEELRHTFHPQELAQRPELPANEDGAYDQPE